MYLWNECNQSTCTCEMNVIKVHVLVEWMVLQYLWNKCNYTTCSCEMNAISVLVKWM